MKPMCSPAQDGLGARRTTQSAKTGSRRAFQLALSRQVIEQCLRLFQIKRVEPFGEPAVDRSKKLASLLRLALRTPVTRELIAARNVTAEALPRVGD